MSPGDFVITANWAPHDHGNTSKKPMLWLDVLDFPQVNFFEASFAEHFDDEPRRRPTAATAIRSAFYGSGVLPDGAPAHMNRSPGHQLHLCAHAADPRAHDEGRRHRQASRRARALRQSDQRRAGAADHGRQPRAASRRASRASTTARPTAPSSSAPKARARPWSTARSWNGVRNDVFVVPPWKHYRAQRRRRNRCCSRSPTARRRKRSASGARTRRTKSRSRLKASALTRMKPMRAFRVERMRGQPLCACSIASDGAIWPALELRCAARRR